MHRVGLRAPCAAGVVSLLAAACASSPPAVNPAADLLDSSLASANRAGSVQFVEVTRSGSLSSTLSGAISAPAARETLVTSSGTLRVTLTRGVIYIMAGATVLQSSLGFSSTAAAAGAGHWVSVQPADRPFSVLAQTLTLQSVLSAFTPGAPGLALRQSLSVHGRRATPITGSPSAARGTRGSVTLFVELGGSHLPIGGTLAVANSTQHATNVVAFEKWGAPVTAVAPPGAVPFASLTSH